jgi:hypothetical protein
MQYLLLLLPSIHKFNVLETMKTKTLLCILSLVLSILSVQAQQFYYSAGKKNYINVDSTVIVAKVKIGTDMNKLQMALPSTFDCKRVHQFKNKELVALKFKNPIRSEEITNPEFERFMYGYKMGDNPFYLTGEILLQPKENVDISQIIKLCQNKIYVITATKYNTYKMGVNDWAEIIKLANKIYESSVVEYCHPNFIAEIVKHQADPLYPEQYYLNNTGQFGGTAGIDINAPEAWAITRGLTPTRVAVIDDGVEDHEDINGRVLQGFTPTDPNGFGAPTNPIPPANLYIIGHGQACAGIIAGTHNNIGIAGISQCSDIIPVNIFNDWFIVNDWQGNPTVRFNEDAFNLGDAIDFAWDPTRGNADVISNSWGYNTTNPAQVPNSDQIIFAINRARTQGRLRNGIRLGCLVVFASGNSNQNFSGVTFPANVNGVITVGAIDNNGNIHSYSSRGAEMNLVAPSGGIPGNVRTTDRMGVNGYNDGNYTNTFNGTSAACPQVSGVAALMISINPNLSETQVRTILQQTATDMGSSGFDNTFGYGRLNAQAALERVRNTLPISGPSIVCSSITTFSLNNLPAGITVNWTKGDNLRPISGQGTASYTVRALFTTGGYTSWVQATLTGPCGTVTLPQKDVWAGKPNPATYISFYPPVPCTNQLVYADATVSNPPLASANYQWYNIGNYSPADGSQVWFETAGPLGYITNVRVAATNTCGSSEYSKILTVNKCSGGTPVTYSLIASPNPSSSVITISEVEPTNDNIPWVLRLMSGQGAVMVNVSSTLPKTLNVSGFQPGVYILHARRGQYVEQQVIIIE